MSLPAGKVGSQIRRAIGVSGLPGVGRTPEVREVSWRRVMRLVLRSEMRLRRGRRDVSERSRNARSAEERVSELYSKEFLRHLSDALMAAISLSMASIFAPWP